MVVLTDVQEIYTVLSKLHVGVPQRYCARTLQTKPAFNELLSLISHEVYEVLVGVMSSL